MDALQSRPAVASRRNPGIDLLRILAAFYIVLLHVLGQGGLYGTTAEGSHQQAVTGLMYVWTFCGVNIFGLISGYVGYSGEDKPIAWRSLLRLWLEVVFYDVGLTLLTLWLRPDSASASDLVPMFFPLLNNSHWYFTAYAVLIPFLPLLNSAVRGCQEKTLLQFLAAVFLLLIPLTCFFGYLYLGYGYSLIWLLILYLTGAILKKTGFGANLSAAVLVCGIVLMNLRSWLLLHKWRGVTVFNAFIGPEVVRQYLFPCHYLSAVFHLLLFSRMKFPPRAGKWICTLAPGAFAVYIINTQKNVWDGYLCDRFVSWAGCSALGILARTVAVSVLFVAVSLAVDWLRRRLFRLLRISRP